MNAQTDSARRKVLLVEDNVPDARLMREYLSEVPNHPFELHHVDSMKGGLLRLEDGGISLVLLDLTLPDSSGLATFHRVHTAHPELPIIVLSGQDDEALAINTVHEGAQDYLVKGQVDGRLLVRAMRYAIERKRVEEALAYERDLFHTLLDNLPDRIYFKDQKSRFTRISRAVAGQFKISDPAEANGKTDFDFFLKEHAQAAFDDEQRILQTSEPVIGKVEKETLPDGSITWALTSKLPLRDKENRIIGIFGISRDITALKLIEDELASERNLLRNLIDNLPDYIYVKDNQGRFLLDNLSHRQFVGVSSAEEILGRTVYDFFPHVLAQQYAKDDQHIITSGQALLNREEMATDQQGNRRWLSSTKVPLRNNSTGEVMGLVGISRDITERKLAEERLQQANEELAQSKAEQEKVLLALQKSHVELKSAQIQLIEAEKMQSVGQLAAGVAHEVKNPLAILGMGIDYLMKNLVAPDANTSVVLNDMSNALTRADRIIHGLLDFSLPRALQLEKENFQTIIEESIALIRHEFGSGIQLERQVDRDLPPVRVDRNKVIQVFVNVLTNAVHAMPEGGSLTVRAYTKTLQSGEVDHDAGSREADQLHPGQTVVVAEVLDTGHGIPSDKLLRVFDPFFTTKPTGKGTGLGLTVTKKIVELHGGSIEVRNRPERGVIVTIKFKA